MDGIRGTVEFTQRSPFDPTWTNFQLGAADQDYESNLRFVSSITHYYIRELPPRIQEPEDVPIVCNTTGALYNPSGVDLNSIPPPGKAIKVISKVLFQSSIFQHFFFINLSSRKVIGKRL